MDLKNAATDEILTTATGRRIGWHARGPRDGAPVLWIHGWPGCRLEQRVVPDEALLRAGVRLVSVDRPGYGNTDPLHAPRSHKALDILAVCDALGLERFSVIAFSAGGSHALSLAAIAPDRVERLVLASALVPHDYDLRSHDEDEALALFRAGRTPALETFRTERREMILDDPVGVLTTIVPSFGERERAWYGQPWVREVYEANLREAFRPGIEGDIEDCLTRVEPFDIDVSTIACAVRATHGSADTATPLATVERVLAHIRDANLIALDGMEHFGPLLDPDRLLSLALRSAP